MQFIKFLTISAALIITSTHAKVNFEMGVMRDGVISLGKTVQLELGKKPFMAYQDNQTYIEAELLSEKDDIPQIRLTIATKCETGAFVVRGIPVSATHMIYGLGMSTLQCDGRGESFTLILAVSTRNPQIINL